MVTEPMAPRPPTLLLVDDTDVVRTTLALLLDLDGWAVAQAASTAEALDAMRAHAESILVAVIDVNLGAESGVNLAERFRDADPALPIVLVTGMDAASVALPEAMVLLIKPFGIADLSDALARATGLVQARAVRRGSTLDLLSTPATSSQP